MEARISKRTLENLLGTLNGVISQTKKDIETAEHPGDKFTLRSQLRDLSGDKKEIQEALNNCKA